MTLEITSRHYDFPDRIKEYAEEEVEKITKIHDRIVSTRVILDRLKEGDMAEINIHISGKDFFASETTDDITKSIDRTVDKIRKQLKRYKGKRYTNYGG